MPPTTTVKLTGTNQDVVLVPRSQLKVTQPHNVLSSSRLPQEKKGVALVPETMDWSRGRSISYPILGNDRAGDCWYAACCHSVQQWTGLNGSQASFDAAQVLERYYQLSGGDNGLYDSQMLPEFVNGIIGPNGPHKVLDWMTVTPGDERAVMNALYYGAGVGFTCGLLKGWLANMRPDALWDSGTRMDPNAGHAMLWSGRDKDGNWLSETWGFSKPVRITPNGLKACDPEIILFASLEMFDKNGKSPSGQSYTEFATWWQSIGGKALPPNPFPGPGPGPGPSPGPEPIPPGNFEVSLTLELPAALGGAKLPIVGTVTATVESNQDVKLVAENGQGFMVYGDGRRKAIPWELLIELLIQLLPYIIKKATAGDESCKRLVKQLPIVLQAKSSA